MKLSRILFSLVALAALSPPALLAQSQVSGTIPSAGGGATCVSINATAQSTVGIQVTGTWTGTLQPEISIQGQSAQNTQVVPSTSSTAASTITANGVYTARVAGGTTFLLCGNTVASGTANIFLNATTAVSLNGIGSGSGGTPGGSTGQLQYNNGGVFGGISNPSTPASVPQFLTETSGNNPAFNLPGVVPRASVCTGNVDTILATDRNGYVSENDASACAVTLPQAGSSGFANNFAFTICDIGAGTATITPTTSTINGSANYVLNQNACIIVVSDNTNYFAILTNGSNFPDLVDTAGVKVAVGAPFIFTANGSVPSGSPTSVFRKSSSIVCWSLGFGDACDFALDATAGYKMFQASNVIWSTSNADATSGIRASLNSSASGVVNAGASTVSGDIQGTFQASTVTIPDAGNASGSGFISFGSFMRFTSSACEASFGITTLSTVATTTNTGQNCLPANAIIDAVVYRITTTITTAANFTIGDSTTAARFCSAQSTLTAGTTGICFVQADQTGAAGPRQTSATTVRVTTNVNPGAGAMRLITYYHTWFPPAS